MSLVERHTKVEKSTARRNLLLVAISVALLLGTAGRIADLIFFHNGSVAAATVERVVGKIQDRIEPAIMLGGILLERTRHMIAGGTLGCAAGAGVAVTVAGGAALLTGGAAGLAIPTAAAIGCGLGAPIGAAFGYPLDGYNWELDLDD
jgi:hypothetical protein